MTPAQREVVRHYVLMTNTGRPVSEAFALVYGPEWKDIIKDMDSEFTGYYVPSMLHKVLLYERRQALFDAFGIREAEGVKIPTTLNELVESLVTYESALVEEARRGDTFEADELAEFRNEVVRHLGAFANLYRTFNSGSQIKKVSIETILFDSLPLDIVKDTVTSVSNPSGGGGEGRKQDRQHQQDRQHKKINI